LKYYWFKHLESICHANPQREKDNLCPSPDR
jgi:hypothetical protein